MTYPNDPATEWYIFYEDELVVWGRHGFDWLNAPSEGVQYVVLMEPYPDGRRPWRGVDDRQIWTGDDEYDPFGWGVKYGSLIDDAIYYGMWDRVAYGQWPFSQQAV